jgi:hypothetical protein
MGGPPASSSRAEGNAAARCVWLVHALADETNEAFYDVNIRVGEECFPAHRAILAVQSPVFRAMFTSNMREQHSRAVEIGDATPQAFRAVLRHAYGASIVEEPLEVIVDIWELADRLQMDSLLEVTTQILTRSMLRDMASLRNIWAAVGKGSRTDGASQAYLPRQAAGSQERPPPTFATTWPASTSNSLLHPSSAAAQGLNSELTGVAALAARLSGAALDTASSASAAGRADFEHPSLNAHIGARIMPVTFLAREIGMVVDSPAFLKFPYALLQRLLSSDSLAISELLLFQRAMCTDHSACSYAQHPCKLRPMCAALTAS